MALNNNHTHYIYSCEVEQVMFFFTVSNFPAILWLPDLLGETNHDRYIELTGDTPDPRVGVRKPSYLGGYQGAYPRQWYKAVVSNHSSTTWRPLAKLELTIDTIQHLLTYLSRPFLHNRFSYHLTVAVVEFVLLYLEPGKNHHKLSRDHSASAKNKSYHVIYCFPWPLTWN